MALHAMAVRPPPQPTGGAAAAAAAAAPSASDAALAAEADGLSLQVELGALGGTMRRLKALLGAVLGYVDEVVVSRPAATAAAAPRLR